jgi:hypothetical protein
MRVVASGDELAAAAIYLSTSRQSGFTSNLPIGYRPGLPEAAILMLTEARRIVCPNGGQHENAVIQYRGRGGRCGCP